MTWAVFVAAISSALLNACWNMLAKLQAAPRDLLLGIVLATASLCVMAIPVVGLPRLDVWLWVLAGSACNVAFTRVLMAAYARGQFGMTYATVRAAIPPTLFLLGWAFMNEAGRLQAVAGLALVVFSLFLFANPSQGRGDRSMRAMALSMAAGILLAFAVLFDVNGIRGSGPGMVPLLSYGLASSLMTSIGLGTVSLAERRNPLGVLKTHGAICYSGAVLLFASYLCGMWAFVHGPIGLVAPLRESGILLGGVLAVVVLRERISRLQWAAMGLATIGVVLIKTG